MIITISGQIGAGKSTLAREIAKRFNLKHISAGEIMRKMAEKHEMSLMEFSKFAELNSWIDRVIDEKQKKLAEKGNCVVEGRISAHFLKPELRIFLIAPLEIRARRIAERDNISGGIRKAIELIQKREESERKRYKKIYHIDFDSFENYDVILNTGVFNQNQLIDIVSAIITKIIISPTTTS
jgi:cytidylate kinase